jgi:hypothetical protein
MSSARCAACRNATPEVPALLTLHVVEPGKINDVRINRTVVGGMTVYNVQAPRANWHTHSDLPRLDRSLQILDLPIHPIRVRVVTA